MEANVQLQARPLSSRGQESRLPTGCALFEGQGAVEKQNTWLLYVEDFIPSKSPRLSSGEDSERYSGDVL